MSDLSFASTIMTGRSGRKLLFGVFFSSFVGCSGSSISSAVVFYVLNLFCGVVLSVPPASDYV